MAIKGVAIIYGIPTNTPNPTCAFQVQIVDDQGRSNSYSTAQFAVNQLNLTLIAAIKADVQAFMTSTWGTTFGLLDTIRLMGAPLDL